MGGTGSVLCLMVGFSVCSVEPLCFIYYHSIIACLHGYVAGGFPPPITSCAVDWHIYLLAWKHLAILEIKCFTCHQTVLLPFLFSFNLPHMFPCNLPQVLYYTKIFLLFVVMKKNNSALHPFLLNTTIFQYCYNSSFSSYILVMQITVVY